MDIKFNNLNKSSFLYPKKVPFINKEVLKSNFTFILLPLIIALVMMFLLLFLSTKLPAKLPLFYSLSWGEGQLVNKGQLLILPATIILVTLINLIISWHLHQKQTLLKNMLISSSLITSIILLLGFLKSISLFI